MLLLFPMPSRSPWFMTFRLLDTKGLYLGASSALNVIAAVKVAQKLGRGKEYSWMPERPTLDFVLSRSGMHKRRLKAWFVQWSTSDSLFY